MPQHGEELQLFIEDALELLAEGDRSVLALDAALREGAQPPAAALNALFRCVHTLKGNAGLMGYGRLVDLAHALEEGLDHLRERRLAVSTPIVDGLFAGLDALRSLIVMVQQGQPEALDVSVLIARLEGSLRLAPTAVEGGLEGLLTGWEQVPHRDARSIWALCGREGHSVYRLTAHLDGSSPNNPLDNVDLLKLAAIGHLLAYRVQPDGGLELAYVSAASLEVLERICPSAITAIALWEDRPADAGPEGAADSPTSLEILVSSSTLQAAPEAAESSLRVGIGLLDKLMNLVGELVLTRNQVLQHLRGSQDAGLSTPVQRLNLITTELQEAIMRTRMQPIGQLWDKFPRLVRDYGSSHGKQVQLVLEGADTELDKSMLETIKDPLTHVVRNALDHGLEASADRLEAGKDAMGTLRLTAYQDGGQILIEVADDGRGIDFERVKAKAVARGMATAEALARMGEGELVALIFKPGFSTAEAVTDISGRGVGMDVVKSNVERIGGTVELVSHPGRGTLIRLRIPLTLAVIPALVILSGGERFAIPQSAVLEVVRTGSGVQRVEQVQQSLVFRLRDALIPVVSLRQTLGLGELEPFDDEVSLVVVQAGSQVFGVAIDAIGDTEEIVVKPLHRFLQALGVYSGVTIMGDGGACMILDVAGLARRGGLEAAARDVEEDRLADRPSEAAREERRMLLVRLADRTYALPMALVSRLEDFAPERFERLGNRLVVQYGALGILEVLRPEGTLGLADENATHVVVVGEGDRRVGLRVHAILDIVEEVLELHPSSGVPGVLGAAVIGGATVEILDVAGLIDAAFPGWLRAERQGTVARRLLVVDDSPFFRTLVRADLEAAGYQVEEAAGADAALQAVSAGAFDAVLSDLEMPARDGWSFARALRESPRTRSLVAVALSGLDGSDERERAHAAGFDAYLVKYDRQAVLAALAELLSRTVREEATQR